MSSQQSIGTKDSDIVAHPQFAEDYDATVHEDVGASEFLQSPTEDIEKPSKDSLEDKIINTFKSVALALHEHSRITTSSRERAEVLNKSLRQVNQALADLTDGGNVAVRLGEDAQKVIDLVEQARNIVMKMAASGSSIKGVELAILRTGNATLTARVEQLEAEEATCKQVLFDNHMSNSKISKYIEELNIPEWIPRSSEQPLNAIKFLLAHKDALYAALSQRCERLENMNKQMEANQTRLETEKAEMALNMKEQQEAIERLTARVNDNSAAGQANTISNAELKSQTEVLKSQRKFSNVRSTEATQRLDQERIFADEAAKRYFEDAGKLREAIHSLQQQCSELSHESSLLQIEAGKYKVLKRERDFAVEQTDKRIKDNQAREVANIASVKAMCDDRVKYATERANQAEKQLSEVRERLEVLKNSANLSMALIQQHERQQGSMDEKLKEADTKYTRLSKLSILLQKKRFPTGSTIYQYNLMH